eukprot:TRINITY_DN6438_c0_g1_i1.p1 TRINITY_DN6438_c0_g1~~TRINITY_DN6438_c0_g1_i1.p1  ORF type:complete len:165 (+),score=28.53 TRINITY_DN6438_c0_g1_i1:603-1097(+)
MADTASAPAASADDGKSVTLTSQDDKSFTIPLAQAKLSETVKNLIDDTGIDSPIPLPNVKGDILGLVLEYTKLKLEKPPKKEGDKEEEIDWPKLKTLEQAALFDLILAANYLDIKSLLDLSCKTVANMIKGKTPDEICHMFGVHEPFTPEEEESVYKENPWLKG